jgi:hypothetical protein
MMHRLEQLYWKAVGDVFDRYGDGTEERVAATAKSCSERGDVQGAAIWERVLESVRAMRAAQPN